MNRIAKFALPALILILAGCSGVKVETMTQVPPKEIATGKKYFLRIQTGDQQMDQFLYEFSFHEISRFLTLVEKEDGADGTVDILFTTLGQNKTVGSGVGVGSASGWYTGAGTSSALAIGSSFYSSETKTKQLSTLVASIKTKDGRRLWWADLDLTGKGSVKTPSGSARHLARELGNAMQSSDFTALRKR